MVKLENKWVKKINNLVRLYFYISIYVNNTKKNQVYFKKSINKIGNIQTKKINKQLLKYKRRMEKKIFYVGAEKKFK